MTAEASTKFTVVQRIVLAVAPRIVWALLSVVGRTWRFEVIAEDGVTPVREGQKAGPEIYCFWHQCVLPGAFYFRGSGSVILISQSFDGELITRILRLFGFDAVRGSSSRGGHEGMLGLARVIESGRTAIFTADGPRGPIYQTKMGPIKLAQTTGAPIGAFHLEPKTASTMNSWDRFLVPLPFTRVCVSWAKPMSVSEAVSPEQLESKRQELNSAIERARLKSYAYLGKARS